MRPSSSAIELGSHSPYRCEIHGARIDDRFDIGVRASPGEQPREDVVPTAIYSTISDMVTAAADLDAVGLATTIDEWPIIGDCSVSKLDGDRILVEVCLRSR